MLSMLEMTILNKCRDLACTHPRARYAFLSVTSVTSVTCNSFMSSKKMGQVTGNVTDVFTMGLLIVLQMLQIECYRCFKRTTLEMLQMFRQKGIR